jgi:hypothetical protein
MWRNTLRCKACLNFVVSPTELLSITSLAYAYARSYDLCSVREKSSQNMRIKLRHSIGLSNDIVVKLTYDNFYKSWKETETSLRMQEMKIDVLVLYTRISGFVTVLRVLTLIIDCYVLRNLRHDLMYTNNYKRRLSTVKIKYKHLETSSIT